MRDMASTPPPDGPGPQVVAAGAVVTRKGPEGREVLLVHRPKYDDWSFPKGKQDPGEHVTATAVREVHEETGVEIRLGLPLRPQQYSVSGGRSKTVHYWVGHVIGDDDVAAYETNEEVDDLGWFLADAAAERLTYLDDIDLLTQFRQRRKQTSTLVVLRHAKALKRSTWDGPDPKRPLADLGEAQARDLAPVLHAYGVARVLSSSSTRCVQTVTPYAEAQLLAVREVDELSEELFDEATVQRLLRDLMETPGPSVLCTHRPVLPRLFELLGLDEETLSPAELVVCHHRRGSVVATERHQPQP
jgi:8-oxo-dGTP pyrophosphatase MutT (NUDIX family)/phosphohistidine phosphatase SixA